MPAAWAFRYRHLCFTFVCMKVPLWFFNDYYHGVQISPGHSRTPFAYLRQMCLRTQIPLVAIALLLGACGPARKMSNTTDPAAPQPTYTISDKDLRLGIPVPPNANKALVQEVNRWLGAPYQYGGSSMQGTDCSGLICSIYPIVYQLKPPRGTATLHEQAIPLRQSELKEGDLVFFTIDTRKPGHSGIYLWDGYFVHASTSRGVMLSNLNETYWKKYFTGGGRLTGTTSAPARR